MGVKGLFPYLRLNAPNCVTQISIESLRGKRIAIDGNLLLFREYASPWLGVLQTSKYALWSLRLARLCRQYAISPIVVFDSPETTPAKAKERVNRTLRRAKAQAALAGTKDRAVRLKELGSTMLAMDGLSLHDREQLRNAVNARRGSKRDERSVMGKIGKQHKQPANRDHDSFEDDATEVPEQIPLLAKRLVSHLRKISSSSTDDGSSELALLMQLLQRNTDLPTEELRELQAATADLVDKLSRRVVRIRPRDVNRALKYLNYFRIPVQLSPDHFEGECTASHFVRRGFADFVATEDSDVLVYGVPQLRGFMGVHNTREGFASLGEMKLVNPTTMRKELLASKDNVLGEMFSESSFLDLAILCGTDFTESIAMLGINKAVPMIRAHGSIEAALPHIIDAKVKSGPNRGKSRYEIHETFMADTEVARRIFTTYPTDHVMLSSNLTSLEAVNRSFAKFAQLSSNPEKWEQIEARILKHEGLSRNDIEMLDHPTLYMQHQKLKSGITTDEHPFNDMPLAVVDGDASSEHRSAGEQTPFNHQRLG